MAQKPAQAEDKNIINLETHFFISLLALGNDERSHKAKVEALEKELESYRQALAQAQAMKAEILSIIEAQHSLEKGSLSNAYQFTGKEFIKAGK